MIGRFDVLKQIHQNNDTVEGFMKEWVSQVGLLCGAGISSDANCLNLSGAIIQQKHCWHNPASDIRKYSTAVALHLHTQQERHLLNP